MNKQQTYFAAHIAEYFGITTPMLDKIAVKIAVAGAISKSDAIQLLGKPTNIQSARSLIKLYASDDDMLFDIK